MSFSEEELKVIEILEDPVKWTETNLKSKEGDFKMRWYQKEIMEQIKNKDDPRRNRIILRWGRRLGKCLPGHIRVLDPLTGEYPTVKELFEEDFEQKFCDCCQDEFQQ